MWKASREITALGAGVYQPEDPWEVRTAAGREEERSRFLLPSESDEREQLLRTEVLVVFGPELDVESVAREITGAGVYQPEEPWEVRERLLEEKRRRGDFHCRQKATFGAERAARRAKFWSFLARN